VIQWSATPTRTTVSGVVNPVDIQFSSNGALFIVNSSGTVYKSTNYTSVSQSRNISGIVPTALRLDESSIYIGHSNGVRVLDSATLADLLTPPDYSWNGSRQVTSMDLCQDHLFIGTSTELNGSLIIFNTKVHRQVTTYTRDQGLSSNDITAVAVSSHPSNFTAAVGAKLTGLTFFRGTLQEVTAFSGLSVQKRDLFGTTVTPPQNDYAVLWFDLINERPVSANITSVTISLDSIGDQTGINVHLYEDVDRSGTFSSGDISWGTHPVAPTITFTAPQSQQIAPDQRMSLLCTLDVPASAAGRWTASLTSTENIVGSYSTEQAIVSGTPITGNQILGARLVRILFPAINASLAEGSVVTVIAEAQQQTEEVDSIAVEATGVDPSQISKVYDPPDSAFVRTVEATFRLPTIAENNGSTTLSITVSITDGASTTASSVPITLIQALGDSFNPQNETLMSNSHFPRQKLLNWTTESIGASALSNVRKGNSR
jgi:hypothetical protein